MMDPLSWVDPTREKIIELLSQMPISQAVRGDVSISGILDNLKAMPKFDRNAKIEDEGAFWNPAGMIGMTKGALPKLAKAAEKSEFATGSPASAVGFHGSPDPAVAFDPARPAFLSSHPDVANDYTSARGLWTSPMREGATVYPAKVEFKNPLVIDAMGSRHDNVPNPWVFFQPKVFGNLPKKALSVSDLADIAKSQGHDGLIVKNVIDTVDRDSKKKSTVYAALAPNSITDFFSSLSK